jgi:hypothetical protein
MPIGVEERARAAVFGAVEPPAVVSAAQAEVLEGYLAVATAAVAGVLVEYWAEVMAAVEE